MANPVELHSAPPALVRSLCARLGAPPLSTRARYLIHSLIEEGNLSWAQSLVCAPHEKLRKGSGNLFLIYYGTLRSFIAVAQSEVREKRESPSQEIISLGLAKSSEMRGWIGSPPHADPVPSSMTIMCREPTTATGIGAAPGRPLFRKHSATMYNSKVGLVLLSEGPQAR